MGRLALRTLRTPRISPPGRRGAPCPVRRVASVMAAEPLGLPAQGPACHMWARPPRSRKSLPCSSYALALSSNQVFHNFKKLIFFKRVLSSKLFRVARLAWGRCTPESRWWLRLARASASCSNVCGGALSIGARLLDTAAALAMGRWRRRDRRGMAMCTPSTATAGSATPTHPHPPPRMPPLPPRPWPRRRARIVTAAAAVAVGRRGNFRFVWCEKAPGGASTAPNTCARSWGTATHPSSVSC